MTKLEVPSAAELYALEQIARTERSRAQAALFASAARWVGDAIAAVFTKPSAARGKVVRHA
ncbi:MAG TPA: hypothetical protein VEB41_11365 [Burkholderiales bacterium]|nr:hypothetical protein [Burkholderiales bacterium]